MIRNVLSVVFVVLVLAAMSSPVTAESVFNLNLLGERMESGDARAISLGGYTQLLDDSLGVLQHNPAMFSMFTRVTFGASQFTSSDLNRSDLGEEQEVSTKFTAFGFAFPLFNKFTIGLTYRGRYDPDASFSIPRVSAEGDDYREEFIRQGGLNSYQMAVAGNLSRFLKVGAYYSIENGSIENRWNTIFENSLLVRAFNIEKRTLSGNGWGLGAVVAPVEGVMLSAMYEAEISYDTDGTLSFTNESSDGQFSEETILPARWTVAAHWHNDDFGVYAGGSVSDFEQFEGLAFPAERLVREDVAALGFEYARGFSVFGRRYPVRLSFTYERLPYEAPAGERIQRVMGGIGTGLLFSGGRGKIDFALQTGKIGSTETNGLSTRVLRLYVGISGSEVWKRKRESAY